MFVRNNGIIYVYILFFTFHFQNCYIIWLIRLSMEKPFYPTSFNEIKSHVAYIKISLGKIYLVISGYHHHNTEFSLMFLAEYILPLIFMISAFNFIFHIKHKTINGVI